MNLSQKPPRLHPQEQGGSCEVSSSCPGSSALRHGHRKQQTLGALIQRQSCSSSEEQTSPLLGQCSCTSSLSCHSLSYVLVLR